MRKGQGLSLNMIIVAVLALIVLVLIVMIFSGKMGDFRKTAAACNGNCVVKASDCGADKNPIFLSGCDANSDGKPDKVNDQNANICCVAVG